MKNIPIFLFYLFIVLPNNLKSEVTIKFKRQKILKDDENLILHNTQFFVDYFIKNKYITDLYLGEPPQKIPGYLNPIQSGFYLTHKDCPSKVIYNYQSSSHYKLIEKTNYGNIILQRFTDVLYVEYINNNIFKKYDYEIFADTDLNNSICFNIGTKLLGKGEIVEDNLLNRLHKNKSIKSYYFSFDINEKNQEEMNYIYDIDIKNNEKGYTFIKASSYTKDNRQYLVWGFDFDILQLNKRIVYERQFRAEFNVNLGCIIGSSSFKESFDLILKEKNINVIKENYDNIYDLYTFNRPLNYEKLKSFTLNFYHKSLDYNFILDYNDLFYEKNDRIIFLIIFKEDKRDYWELGTPFLKRYKFIYNQDNKFIGFIKDNKENKFKDNEKGDNRKLKSTTKIVVLVVLLVVFIIILTLIFGFLIGKKMYKVRKNKTNELLELYDYNSKSEGNK